MIPTIPLPVWQHGTDPEGSECWTLADPARPGWRVVVARWYREGSAVWSADYLRDGEWWWHAPHSDPQSDAVVPRSRSLDTCLRAGTLRIYGHTPWGEYVWRMMCDAGVVPTQDPTPAPEIRPPTA